MPDPWTVETITEEKVAQTIDHSLLRPELTLEEVLAGCDLAAAYRVASVCCRPLDVASCRDALAGSGVAVGTVVGFPHGASTSAVKAAEAARPAGAIVKVILENAYLTDEEKVRGCQLAERAGADFVKTSTGYAPSGSTMDDLRLLRASVSPRVKVKAAGGIRTLDLLVEGLNAGMDRCGATATAAIIDDLRRRQGR